MDNYFHNQAGQFHLDTVNMKEYHLEKFRDDLADLDLILSERQLEQFVLYYQMLVEKNRVMNLTAITEFDDVIKKHFVDSLSLVKAYSKNNFIDKYFSVLDVGTGAGFPGIPLKIVFPNLKITLMDSLNKRVVFLQEVIASLNLEDIEALHGRAEDFAKQGQFREKFDLCVSRAVANLATLSEYCLPYVKVGGSFISYKSEKVTDEVKNAEHAISVLGGKIENQISFILPDSDLNRSLLVVKKIAKTPNQYPRKAGVAGKRPL